MTRDTTARRVILGFDGSAAAINAIDVGARLVPHSTAWITYLWGPPFAGEHVRRRLWEQVRDAGDLIELVRREGQREADRITATGVALARAAGWQAEPLLQRSFGAEGTGIAGAADDKGADLVIVGSRGLSGSGALLGSVSDMAVHHCSQPVIVVPYPMLSAEVDALAEGPVAIGWDGSAGARTALSTAAQMFPERRIVAISVAGADAAEPDGGYGRRLTHVSVDRGRGFHHRAIAGALIDAAADHGAAVVVVGSRGQSAAREIVLGSVAMGTLHHSHRPVMVVADR